MVQTGASSRICEIDSLRGTCGRTMEDAWQEIACGPEKEGCSVWTVGLEKEERIAAAGRGRGDSSMPGLPSALLEKVSHLFSFFKLSTVAKATPVSSSDWLTKR